MLSREGTDPRSASIGRRRETICDRAFCRRGSDRAGRASRNVPRLAWPGEGVGALVVAGSPVGAELEAGDVVLAHGVGEPMVGVGHVRI
jgi:hypothetical protein